MSLLGFFAGLERPSFNLKGTSFGLRGLLSLQGSCVGLRRAFSQVYKGPFRPTKGPASRQGASIGRKGSSVALRWPCVGLEGPLSAREGP